MLHIGILQLLLLLLLSPQPQQLNGELAGCSEYNLILIRKSREHILAQLSLLDQPVCELLRLSRGLKGYSAD